MTKAGQKQNKIAFTAKLLSKIKELAGYGLNQEQIASVIGSNVRTLQRHATREMQEGRDAAGAAVAQSAYQQAISGKNPAMTMFWLKCRMRWSEVAKEEDNESDKKLEAARLIISAMLKDTVLQEVDHNE